jgi:exodeoxyribonuclease VII large subunit
MDVPTPVVVQVSQAIEFCNGLFQNFELFVEGEVANFSISRGKFVFFDLKDEEKEARLSCFMMLHQQNVPLEDGMRIVVQAKPTVFTKSGKFSLTVSRIEPKGEGSVKRAFQLLTAKLDKEGLFALNRKRTLPRFVETVGIISSADAAGFGDFMRIAQNRLPGVQYLLANVAVQGKDAESEIVAAFDYLNTLANIDAIVLIRGGGSMEDLHAFNSEVVARAIVRSKAPVVVGVGHERDITIADYCADIRAATPSNAAQLLVPTKEEVEELVYRLTQGGTRRISQYLAMTKQQIAYTVTNMHDRLGGAIKQSTEQVRRLMSTITALSPQNTLARGYSLTTTIDGKVVKSAKTLTIGVSIHTHFAEGEISSTVTSLQ